MTEITDEGRKLAAELANAELGAQGIEDAWGADDFDGGDDAIIALARLATDHLALKARNAETEAKHENAVADLREIAALLANAPDSPSIIADAKAIAAKYRETDPLVEALAGLLGGITAEKLAPELRSQLSKRGFELARVKP